MKSKISYSRFANILTAIVSGVLFVACIATVREEPTFLILLAIYLVLFVSILFFGAAYIKADSNYIVLGSLLRGKKIPMSDVESVELFKPGSGAIRVCGSGGFMGYWGIFRETGIGKYYAFYGKSSDCFLVSLNNGKTYLLGCNQPEQMVEYIKSQIRK
ncbi:MAG: PH domain-containing protein [Muribaculaceae bacterium]|nr:PH domain-containing protein [Muribaculaceae bacterium]